MIMAWTDYSSAPAPGTRVCVATGITGVHPLTVTTDRGSFPMIVLRDGDVLRAYVNACPHQYLPLDYRGEMLLSADGLRLLCTAHGAASTSRPAASWPVRNAGWMRSRSCSRATTS